MRKLAGTVPGYSGTIAAMIDAYFASPEFKGTPPDFDDGLAASSRKIYTLYLGHVRLAIGKHRPDAIRPSHVLALRDQYATTPGAANALVRALSAAYKWGVLRDHATINPCLRVPKFKSGEHEPWPQEMIDLVLAKARWEVRRFVLLTLYTGQREGDVCAMSLHDVKDGEIRVVQEKTGKELWITLDWHLLPIIEECRAAGTMYLLPRQNGEPYTAHQFRAMWDREMEKDAMKPIREAGLVPHGLCKNAHNQLFEAGSNDKEVQAVTGRSRGMVEHYSKRADQRVLARRAIRRREEAESVLQTPEIPKQNQARASAAL